MILSQALALIFKPRIAAEGKSYRLSLRFAEGVVRKCSQAVFDTICYSTWPVIHLPLRARGCLLTGRFRLSLWMTRRQGMIGSTVPAFCEEVVNDQSACW